PNGRSATAGSTRSIRTAASFPPKCGRSSIFYGRRSVKAATTPGGPRRFLFRGSGRNHPGHLAIPHTFPAELDRCEARVVRESLPFVPFAELVNDQLSQSITIMQTLESEGPGLTYGSSGCDDGDDGESADLPARTLRGGA